MKLSARLLWVALFFFSISTVDVSHSGNSGPYEAVVKIPARSLVVGSVSGSDCIELVRWIAAAVPQASTPHCQGLHGQAETFRLRWAWAGPDSLIEWLSTQKQSGRIEWFEFAGKSLRTQGLVAITSTNFYDRLEPLARTSSMPSIVSEEALRLQNLLRIYRPTGVVTVAVIDSGVNFDVPELTPLRFFNAFELPGNDVDDDGNGYVDDVSGWDFVDDGSFSWFDDTQTPDNDPQDLLGHGTVVARLVAASAGSDAAKWLRILPLRVASGTNGVGSISPFALAEAIRYATAKGVSVLNLSVGSAQSYQVVKEAINDALAAGVMVVVAAGNSSGAVYFPANVSGVLAVGAADAQGQIWAGSGRGPEVAFYLRGTDMLRDFTGVSSVLSANGTSYAAPAASAMVSMLFAVASNCSTSTSLLTFRPNNQESSSWVGAIVNRFEAEVHESDDLPERWMSARKFCAAELTVAALLRKAH